MKKMLFLMLFLISLGTAGLYAQVTIGVNEPPHPGAVLDLKSHALGLKLPVVFLQDVKVFQLSEDGSDATGMIVYNAFDATTDGRGPGLYVWDGSKWAFVGVSGPVQTPVTNITVYSQGDATTVTSGNPLLFTAMVLPSNATNQVVTWTISGGTGGGSIDRVSGLFTAGAPGTVTIRATATDGNAAYGEKTITVTQGSVPVTGITNITGGTSMQAPGTLQLSASVTPSTATNQTVVWSIVGGSGATVDGNGLVTATTSSGSPIVVRAAADECKTTCYKELTITISPATITLDCSGCRSLLEQFDVSKSTFPYYFFGPGIDQTQYCIARASANNNLAAKQHIYRHVGETWVYEGEVNSTMYYTIVLCGMR